MAVFHGAQDTIVAPDAGRTLARRLPNGAFRSLDPGGHLCFLTYWTQLLDTLAAKNKHRHHMTDPDYRTAAMSTAYRVRFCRWWRGHRTVAQSDCV